MKVEEISKYLSDFLDNEINFITNNNSSNFFNEKYILYGKDYGDNNGFRELWGKKGIYMFFLDENVDLDYTSVKNFNDCASGGKFKEYKPISLLKGDCLYVGSSTSESLYTRINQHFKKSSCYSSLHLQEEKRKILKDKVKIIVFPVKNKTIKHLELLLKCIEKELHKKYQPKSGSNRV